MSGFEKGPTSQFLFLIAHNFKVVIARGLKPGVAILQSLQYTRCKFHTTPHFWFGRGDHEFNTQSKISHFMPQVGAPPFQVRR